jgi:hypothetical protein
MPVISSLDMIEGDLPQKAKALVTEWAKKYQTDLQMIWDEQNFKKLPPLE